MKKLQTNLKYFFQLQPLEFTQILKLTVKMIMSMELTSYQNCVKSGKKKR